jgi:hypothetical protein
MWRIFATTAGAVALAASTLALPAAVPASAAPGAADDLLVAVDNARQARAGEAATVDGQSLAAVSKAARAAVDDARGMKGDPRHYNCDWQKDVLSGKMGNATKVWWDAYQFHYWCQPEADEHDRLPFASPSITRVAYNVEGDHMGCFKVDGKFQRLEANLYFWRPYDGRNFNPGKFTIPCDKSTRNSESQFYKREDVPRFYMGPGDHKSYWKINLEVIRTGLNSDDSKGKAFTPSTW